MHPSVTSSQRPRGGSDSFFKGLWQPRQLVYLLLATALVLCFEEWIAQQVNDPILVAHQHERAPGGVKTTGLGHTSHLTVDTLLHGGAPLEVPMEEQPLEEDSSASITDEDGSNDASDASSSPSSSSSHRQPRLVSLKSLTLPNHWIWYDSTALHDIIELQAKAHHFNGFLGLLVFNASVAAPVVLVTHLVLLMILLRAVLPPQTTTWITACCWLLPLTAFACDLFEDVGLLIVTLGYPMHQYPRLLSRIASAATLKYLLWFLLLVVVDGLLLVVRLYRGPRRKTRM